MNSRDELVAALYENHEDFDGLLEESSLSTAAARKNQAETPIETYQRIQDHLRSSEVACRQGDVDDFLLHLVRLYSVSNDTDPAPSVLVKTVFSITFRNLRWYWGNSEMLPGSVVLNRWERQERPSWNAVDFTDFAFLVRADVVPGIVQTLLDKEVFSYLRQDVARSMVFLCFNSRRPLPLVILNACAAAVPASSFRDELADAFMNMMPTERTALPAGWLQRLDEQNSIYCPGLQVCKQVEQPLAMTRPEKCIDATAQSPRLQDSKSITDLLQRVCERDPAAWDETVHRYSGVVFVKVSSFGLQDTDASDVVQMIWLRLTESCHRIQLPDHLGGWLATTAIREFLRILHHRAAAAVTGSDLSIGSEQCIVNTGTAQRLWNLVTTRSSHRPTLLRELLINNPRSGTDRSCNLRQRRQEVLDRDSPPEMLFVLDEAALRRHVDGNTGIRAGGTGFTRARALTQLRRRLAGTRYDLVTLRGHTGWVRGWAWAPDSQLLATASSNSITRIWNTDNSNELVVLHEHDDEIREVEGSTYGQRLATVSNDYIWILTWICDADNGSKLAVLRGHDGEAQGMVVDNDELQHQVSERLHACCRDYNGDAVDDEKPDAEATWTDNSPAQNRRDVAVGAAPRRARVRRGKPARRGKRARRPLPTGGVELDAKAAEVAQERLLTAELDLQSQPLSTMPLRDDQ